TQICEISSAPKGLLGRIAGVRQEMPWCAKRESLVRLAHLDVLHNKLRPLTPLQENDFVKGISLSFRPDTAAAGCRRSCTLFRIAVFQTRACRRCHRRQPGERDNSHVADLDTGSQHRLRW